ncbi:ChaN family lipoprotein [Bdellovibrio sp. ArHS]|uniref:ChaN family lipoprotein n=1 Tax=Bdellovibrio sp. ArHS TaxID=1569284 RepID=UPI0025BE624E|nr:ChaN family lipoprotein [Bdellovibrio sp. ArHS]
MKTWSLFLISLLMSACAHAQSEGILRGNDHIPVTLQDAVATVTPGSIVIIGENHGFAEHRDQQVAIMQALRAKGLKVSVGMEFFTYTDQELVNSYRAGSLAEPDFLKAIQWGNPSYDYYRPQALFPLITEGAKTLALNAPRSVTGSAAKKGLEALTPEEKALLPPGFTLGRDSYKRRFLSMMPHLPSPEAGERYFAAQSIWDDTMAWKATEFMASHPDQVLVIVVGEFHVQYGGGLPDRLRARSPQTPLLTFSQINIQGMEEDEIAVEIQPSPQEGPRADYLWLAPAQSLGL